MLRFTSKKKFQKGFLLQILFWLEHNKLEICWENIVALHRTLCSDYVVVKFRTIAFTKLENYVVHT